MENEKIERSGFIITIDDGFCKWEFGFSNDDLCIEDFTLAIEEKLNIKKDYQERVMPKPH